MSNLDIENHVDILFRVIINKSGLKPSSENYVANQSLLLLDESQDNEKANQFWFYEPEVVVQKYMQMADKTHVFEM